jgi:hypothetical protein
MIIKEILINKDLMLFLMYFFKNKSHKGFISFINQINVFSIAPTF